MISFLRHLIVEDFWLKLFSLALAVLIWLTVSFASQKEVGTETRVFSSLPVSIVSSSEDVHNFGVNPNRAEVTVRGDPQTVQDLDAKDILVSVDLTGVGRARDLRMPLWVSVPPGVAFMRVAPEEVQVIFPPER